MKVIYLTNIPVHYKDKIHEKLSKKLNKNYTVIYCNKIEPNRKWKNKLGKYKKIFLNSRPINSGFTSSGYGGSMVSHPYILFWVTFTPLIALSNNEQK